MEEIKTKRIMKNALITGFMFVAVALIFAPANWWSRLLGILAGISAAILSGYLLCDFQKVVRKAPIAWEKAKGKSPDVIDAIRGFLKWAIESRPFLHLTSLFFMLNAVALLFLFLSLSLLGGDTDLDGAIFIAICGGIVSVPALYLGILILSEKYSFFWRGRDGTIFHPSPKCYMEMPVDYYNVAYLIIYATIFSVYSAVRLVGKVIYKTAEFIAWNFWAYSFLLIFFFVRFIVHLYILVHSEERFIWTLDGILGGMFVYLYIVPPVLVGSDRIFYCICGGLLGAGFGAFNSEIVTKRFLKNFLRKNPAWQLSGS